MIILILLLINIKRNNIKSKYWKPKWSRKIRNKCFSKAYSSIYVGKKYTNFWRWVLTCNFLLFLLKKMI
jgi:hypothetical protein